MGKIDKKNNEGDIRAINIEENNGVININDVTKDIHLQKTINVEEVKRESFIKKIVTEIILCAISGIGELISSYFSGATENKILSWMRIIFIVLIFIFISLILASIIRYTDLRKGKPVSFSVVTSFLGRLRLGLSDKNMDDINEGYYYVGKVYMMRNDKYYLNP